MGHPLLGYALCAIVWMAASYFVSFCFKVCVLVWVGRADAMSREAEGAGPCPVMSESSDSASAADSDDENRDPFDPETDLRLKSECAEYGEADALTALLQRRSVAQDLRSRAARAVQMMQARTPYHLLHISCYDILVIVTH